MQPFETIILSRAAGVATLTLNRPQKLNSFNRQMHAELRTAFESIELDVAARTVRALIITGAGRAFCTGQDLTERKVKEGEAPPDLGASLRDNYNPLVRRITDLPVPVIAAVNGVASGSGANLALACDLVIAAHCASFSQPFSRLGLIPDGGGTWMLPRLIGLARAKALTFLADSLSAVEAQQYGLIWKVVDDADLFTAASALATHLAAQATQSFALQKRAYATSLQNTLVQQLELEAQLQAQAGNTADYREGVDSFFDKRQPRFRGE